MDETIKQQIQETVNGNEVVLFMKGNRMFPQCGFSAQVVNILKQHGKTFKDINVLQDPALRQGIKDFSEWPTIPQLYVNGKFIGGCDIVSELHDQGELAKILNG